MAKRHRSATRALTLNGGRHWFRVSRKGVNKLYAKSYEAFEIGARREITAIDCLYFVCVDRK